MPPELNVSLHSLEINPSVQGSPTLHWSKNEGLSSVRETLAIEAPLAVEMLYQKNGQEIRRRLGITMRTPGNDEELAFGLLCAEGLISEISEVKNSFAADPQLCAETTPIWCVELARAPNVALQSLSRTLVTSSACGLCGRDGLASLPFRKVPRSPDRLRLSCEMIAALPEKLRSQQSTFSTTGGSHAAALCDAAGSVYLCREDVGRHNAVDKLIGAALIQNLSLLGKVLVLSGRASFELIQKAAVAGIGIVVAVGAPSSAAVDLAHASDVTLIGFTRETRFNVYTHGDRIAL